MLKPTGPGKVSDVPSVKNPLLIIKGLLFNYDIDGDKLKPEHQAWLKENVVPHLADAQAVVSLRGEASRSGDAAYNMALSRRRVAGVEAFLRGNPPVKAGISTSAGGEDDAELQGVKNGTEDERSRAVIVTVEISEKERKPVEFLADGNPAGFDDTATPPWLMLPFASSFRMMKIVNAEGLTLISSNPNVVTVQPALFRQDQPLRITQQTQRFRLFPGINGDAFITAVDAKGKVHARLDISVFLKLMVKTAFHYVRNEKYGTNTRNPGDETAFLEKMNDVWGTQANINFDVIRVRELTMTENLGTRINTNAKFKAMGAHRVSGVQFNVFFVRETQVPGDPDSDDSDGVTFIGPPGDCFFEDADAGGGGSDPLVISHEAGHCMTIDHEVPIHSTSEMLMNHVVSKPFLPKPHVLRARKGVKK